MCIGESTGAAKGKKTKGSSEGAVQPTTTVLAQVEKILAAVSKLGDDEVVLMLPRMNQNRRRFGRNRRHNKEVSGLGRQNTFSNHRRCTRRR